jgi:hypothetical protein
MTNNWVHLQVGLTDESDAWGTVTSLAAEIREETSGERIDEFGGAFDTIRDEAQLNEYSDRAEWLRNFSYHH